MSQVTKKWIAREIEYKNKITLAREKEKERKHKEEGTTKTRMTKVKANIKGK